jgi:PAS domain S-box-containing protein
MSKEPGANGQSDSHPLRAERRNRSAVAKSIRRRKEKERIETAGIEFGHIVERINEGFVALDPQMNYMYINQQGSELLRRRPEDLVGKNYWDVYPQDKETAFGRAYLRALETQTPIELEDYYAPGNRWFENRIYPSARGLSIFFNDITARKRAEEESNQLLHSEQAQRASAEQELAERKLAEQALGVWASEPLPHEVRPAWMKYGAAALITMLAVFLRILFTPTLADFVPLATIYGAVAFSVWYGGLGPALLSAIAGYLGVAWFILEPHYASVLDARNVVGLGLFLISNLVVMSLGEEMRRARRHAHQSAQVAVARQQQAEQRLAEQKQVEATLRLANEQAKKAADRISRLQQITAALTGLASPSHLAETILKQGIEASEAVAAILVELLENGQELKTLAALGYPEGAVRTEPVPLSNPTPMSDCIRTRQAIWIHSQAEFADRYPAIAELRRSLGNEATAALPLIVGEKVLGGLAFSFVEVQDFEKDERSFFLAVAQRCAQALERARTEELLKREREILERLVETMPVMVSMYYPESNSVRLNAEFERTLGWKTEEVTMVSLLEGLYPDLEYRNEVVRRMAAAQANEWVEVRVRTRDGRTLDSLWANISIIDGEQIIRGIGMGIDITERKKAEFKLRQSEERERVRAAQLETIMEAVPAVIWIAHDRECNVVTGNRASYEILRLPVGGNASLSAPAGTGPTNFQVWHDGRVLQPEELPVQRATRGEDVYNFEEELRFEDGTSIYLFGNAITLRDVENKPSGALAAFVDITERKRAEEALRQLNLQLEQRVHDRTAELRSINEQLLEQMQERALAEEALRESHQRLQVLSKRLVEVQEEERLAIARELHDAVGQSLAALNINLSIINNQLSPIVNMQVKERLSDSVSLVMEIIDRVRNVMSDLRPSVLDDFGLEAALQMAVDKFKSRYGIAVRMDKNEALIPRLGTGIEMTLFRIAQEGLLNVVRHAQANQAALSLKLEEKVIRLHISDNGVGIPIGGPVPAGAGGHGLMIMRERAEAVGGAFHVSSAPGQGTQIEVSVPFQQENRQGEDE